MSTVILFIKLLKVVLMCDIIAIYVLQERKMRVDFDYRVIKSDRRTVGYGIVDGEVIIRVPKRMTRADVKRFVGEYSEKIRKMLEKYNERQRKYSDVKPFTDGEIKELTERARLIIPQRVAHYAELVGVEYGRVTVRCQRTRWGSCSAKGNLNFNCLLMLAPQNVLDSVVVHELCHIKEMNHSDRFYAEVLRVMPNYRESHGWLKENGEYLMKRLDKREK